MESQYKKEIISSIDILIQSLESIDNQSLDNVKDEQLLKSFENIRQVIFKGISNIKEHIERLSNVAEWDRLNVSFFGETNAGKSTIIESLINGDGSSIGEGYKDCTKIVIKISYKDIDLMDMPGIEGRESKVIKNIREAVDKSHVIFYVIGTNKEPEEQTISKIKNFLKDTVKVYSIINVRGKPTAYKYKKELKDKNILTVEDRVKKKFATLLGGNYVSNVVVNGYLSLLTSNRLKKTRFEKDQVKAIDIFGSVSKIKSFSNINEINSIIDQLSKNINDEITISNTYKFLKSLELTFSKIQGEKKNFDSFVKEIISLTDKYLDDVEKIISKYESEINANRDVNINTFRVELKKTISQAIDNGDSESSIKSSFDKVKQKQSKKLNKDIKDLLSSMKDEIEEKITDFNDRISLHIQFLNLKGDFNLESILESLEINFNYVLGQILDVGFSILGVITAFSINPILGIITGLFAFFKNILNWLFYDPDLRKRDTKRKAFNKIDSTINDIEKKIKTDLEREFSKVNKNIEKPVLQLRASMKGIKNISLSIDDKISDINRSQTNLSLLLMRKFLGENVRFAYLDLDLSEAVILGYSVNTQVKYHLTKIFRIKKINLYSECSQWLSEAGVKDGTDIFIAKDEFNCRAIKALSLHDSNEFHFKRVI